MQFDDHGQPPEAVYRVRVQWRKASEMIGLCKGMICDGILTDEELQGLKRWMHGNPDTLIQYPGKPLAERLLRAFHDGRIDEEERAELTQMMQDLTGDTVDLDQPMNLSTRLPLDEPVPTILFDSQEYVFTGCMLYGTRKQCEVRVQERGGRCHPRVRRETDFVVVGPIGSKAWIESTHGTKIARAWELKQDGCPIHLVSEESWIQALDL